ncbi:MAG: phage tail length tape measure family protein [Rhizobiaceae bacterium]|nr:phage tail length tape measure family protein [Rhizobiaceae bacterium]
MSGPMRLSLAITADASGVAPATAEARREIEGVSEASRRQAAANDQAAAAARRATEALRGQSAAERDLRAAVASFAGIRSPMNDNEYRQRAADVQAYGDALDRLRARYNPLFAVTRQYLQGREEIRRAHAIGAISANEMTEALSRERQATLASIAAIKGRNAAIADTPVMRGAGASTFNTANIAAQFQDIGVTSAMGMSPTQIALQQGTQLSAVLNSMGGSREVVAGLGAAFMQIVNPISLATIGVVGLTAAVVQYAMTLTSETKSLDDLLKDHADILEGIGDIYDGIAEKAEAAFGRTTAGLRLLSTETQNSLRLQVASSAQNAIGQLFYQGGFGDQQFHLYDDFYEFADAIEHLRKSAEDGEPDVLGFRKMIEERWALDPNNQALTKMASELLAMTRDAEAAARALGQLGIANDTLRRSLGTGGLPLRGGNLSTENMGSYDLFQSEQAVAQQRQREAFEANVMGIRARSPGERAAAARAEASATYNMDESASDRALRIELAGMQALISAEHELTQARNDRLRALDQAVSDQQLELDLIGATAGEAARLRMEYDLTAQLREEAARTGVAVDQQEIELIRKKAAEVGNYADKIAATQLERDLMFERDQIFRSPTEQRVYSTLRSAGIDPASERGQAIADQIRYNEQLSFGRDLANDLGNSLVQAFSDGKLEGEEFLQILLKIIQQLMNAPGGLSGFVSSIFGGGGTTAFTGDILSGARVGLFDSGGTILDDGNIVPFGPKTRRLGNGAVLADSGLGPRHFKAVLEKGETVLDRSTTMRAMNLMSGASALGGMGGPLGGVLRLVLEPSKLFDVRMEEVSGDVAQRVSVETVKQYDKTSTSRFNRDAQMSKRLGAR